MKSSTDLRFVLFWKPVDTEKKDGHFFWLPTYSAALTGTPRELLIKNSTIEHKLCYCLKKSHPPSNHWRTKLKDITTVNKSMAISRIKKMRSLKHKKRMCHKQIPYLPFNRLVSVMFMPLVGLNALSIKGR